jgi:hypothetical protein
MVVEKGEAVAVPGRERSSLTVQHDGDEIAWGGGQPERELIFNREGSIVGLIQRQAVIVSSEQKVGEHARVPHACLAPMLHNGMLPDDGAHHVTIVTREREGHGLDHGRGGLWGVEVNPDVEEGISRDNSWESAEHLRRKRGHRLWRVECKEARAEGPQILLREPYHETPPRLL